MQYKMLVTRVAMGGISGLMVVEPTTNQLISSRNHTYMHRTRLDYSASKTTAADITAEALP